MTTAWKCARLPDFQHIVERPSWCCRGKAFHGRRYADPDQRLGLPTSVDEPAHDIAAFVQLDQMGERASRHTAHRAFQKYARQCLAAAENLGSGVASSRQHNDLRPVQAEVWTPVGIAAGGEIPRDIDAPSF